MLRCHMILHKEPSECYKCVQVVTVQLMLICLHAHRCNLCYKNQIPSTITSNTCMLQFYLFTLCIHVCICALVQLQILVSSTGYSNGRFRAHSYFSRLWAEPLSESGPGFPFSCGPIVVLLHMCTCNKFLRDIYFRQICHFSDMLLML